MYVLLFLGEEHVKIENMTKQQIEAELDRLKSFGIKHIHLLQESENRATSLFDIGMVPFIYVLSIIIVTILLTVHFAITGATQFPVPVTLLVLAFILPTGAGVVGECLLFFRWDGRCYHDFSEVGNADKTLEKNILKLFSRHIPFVEEHMLDIEKKGRKLTKAEADLFSAYESHLEKEEKISELERKVFHALRGKEDTKV